MVFSKYQFFQSSEACGDINLITLELNYDFIDLFQLDFESQNQFSYDFVSSYEFNIQF